jgi:hypothetical protein
MADEKVQHIQTFIALQALSVGEVQAVVILEGGSKQQRICNGAISLSTCTGCKNKILSSIPGRGLISQPFGPKIVE